MADKQFASVRSSEVTRPTFENSQLGASGGKYRNTIVTTGADAFYDSQGSNTTDSFMMSGTNLNTNFGNRATEMKITATEPDEGSPAERPRDYKGRYRVRIGVAVDKPSLSLCLRVCRFSSCVEIKILICCVCFFDRRGPASCCSSPWSVWQPR